MHAFNAHVKNEVGAPYMLLTYIHGTIADEIEGIELATDVEGTRHVLNQLAKIMVELATCKFDRIGSIFTNADGDFEIGPLLETDSGPYSTAQEYYKAISDHRFHVYADRCFANNQEAARTGGLHLPLLFNSFMPMFANSRVDKGPFSLTNTDFGPHNVLVDEQLNIVGLIDCDNIFAAPIHVVAQMPSAGCMNPGLPGLKLRRPIAQRAVAEGQIWQERFIPMVAAAEQKSDQGTPIADAMTSDAAWLVKGMEHYQHHQSLRLADWVNCYWYLYYRRTLGKASFRNLGTAAADSIAGPSTAVEFEEAAGDIDRHEVDESDDDEAVQDVGEEEGVEEGDEEACHGIDKEDKVEDDEEERCQGVQKEEENEGDNEEMCHGVDMEVKYRKVEEGYGDSDEERKSYEEDSQEKVDWERVSVESGKDDRFRQIMVRASLANKEDLHEQEFGDIYKIKGPVEEGAATEGGVDGAKYEEEAKKETIVASRKKSEEELMTDLAERLGIELKEIVDTLKKEVKAELKQLKLELVAELTAIPNFADSQRHRELAEIQGQRRDPADGVRGTGKSGRAEGEAASTKEVAHEIPNEETEGAPVARENHVEGEAAGDTVDKGRVVDAEG